MSTMMEGLPLAHETEVAAKARQRRFTAAEKLRVLRAADRCSADWSDRVPARSFGLK